MLGVAIEESEVVAVGIDSSSGLRWVSARTEWGLTGEWDTETIGVPGTAIIPTGSDFVARGRIDGDEPGYLRSSNGNAWEPLAPMVLSEMGEVAEVTSDDDGLGLRLLDDDRILRPPDWPVRAVWNRGERIWIQTSSAAWWTTDGIEWTELPMDRDHGLPLGSPTILPFDDRVVALVAANPSSQQTIHVWYLGG